ncbi:TOTE conflict system archaeo-eukaryotic primase domain-containing protein [Amycolatopsis nivea]|uniref:TOTE conflict system archaeo-eukaryotic primase domain-containing protein n=1 Tax=Amycolatopsis nivea TaxID=1644109 RepID=UPI003F6B2043
MPGCTRCWTATCAGGRLRRADGHAGCPGLPESRQDVVAANGIAPVPAETARRLGTALLREAMAVRGRRDLASYDRLFPAQDVLRPSTSNHPEVHHENRP